MTPEAVIDLIPGKVIITQGQVIFNTSDLNLAMRWADMGATMRPWYSDIELHRMNKAGRPTRQSWEVSVLGAVEPVYIEDEDGDLVYVTRDLLLAAAREKLGLKVPA